MNKYKTLASNTVLISIGTFGSKILMFLMVRFYTGYLTPEDYSTADLLTQTSNLLIPLVSLGITDGVFRFAIDHKGARSSVFTAGFYTVSVGCILLVLFALPVSRISSVSSYVWLVTAFVAASCYHSLCAQFVRAAGNTKLFAVQGLINTALMVSLNILFLAKLDLGIAGYMLAVAAANLLSTVFMVYREKLWQRLVWNPNGRLAKEMLRYSVPLIPTSIFWWITSVSDRYMVAAILGGEANGIYSVAYKIPTILTIISTIFIEAWQLSAVSEAQGDRREHIRFYSMIWRAFQAVMFLCGAGIIAFSQVEIRLLSTAGYFSAWRYVPLLSIAMVFSSFSTFLGSVYVVMKKSSLSFWTAMIGAAINIALNLLLIPSPLGIQGAAAATLASYIVVFIIRAVSARRLIPFRLSPGVLLINFALLSIQTVFIAFQLPMWQSVQAISVALVLLFNYRPLLTGLKKLDLFRHIRRGNS